VAFQLSRPQHPADGQTAGLTPEHITEETDRVIQVSSIKRRTGVLDLTLQTRIEFVERLLGHG
jgi:hypothetical protein